MPIYPVAVRPLARRHRSLNRGESERSSTGASAPGVWDSPPRRRDGGDSGFKREPANLSQTGQISARLAGNKREQAEISGSGAQKTAEIRILAPETDFSPTVSGLPPPKTRSRRPRTRSEPPQTRSERGRTRSETRKLVPRRRRKRRNSAKTALTPASSARRPPWRRSGPW